MKTKDQNGEKHSFWIVYADLMAGLLFVFILLVGAIVIKYVFAQSSLKQTQVSLKSAQDSVVDKEQAILALVKNLKSQEKKSAELDALNKIFSDKLDALKIENIDLKKSNSIFILQIADLEEMAKKLQEQNFDLNKTASEQNTTLSENEIKIAFLLDTLSSKEAQFQKILHDLNVTKNRIKNLTGVKVKVIADIKEKLGNSVSIDPKSGALMLSSSVLFDKGSAILKDEAKPLLEKTLKNYFGALMMNEDIRANLENISIVGYTDSDGSYIYNLNLSQERAFSVMEFINSFNKDERLKRYLIASGRSYNDLVYKDGIEDKESSRRIEIKFNISNQEAVKEIQKFLEFDANATAK